MTRALLSSVVAVAFLAAPTAAGASNDNAALAGNQTNGAAVVEASVDYRKIANGRVDPVNVARAQANCVDCQTVAAAFQLVLVTKDWHTFVPRNQAVAVNVACDECVTWASAKQVLVASGGPAALSEAGHARLRTLEDRLEAIEVALPTMTLSALLAELDDAYAELLAIANEEIFRTDGGPDDTEVVAARSA